MRNPRKPLPAIFACSLSVLASSLCGVDLQAQTTQEHPAEVIRFATFNAALSGETAEELSQRLSTPDDEKLKKVAAIIQTVRPDVLLINEFDHDPTGQLAEQFQKNYLGVAQHGAEPITFAHAYSPEVNTGLPTGLDLNGDGTIGGAPDAHGWGEYPGQYGMLLLSQAQDEAKVVTDLQTRPWKRFPKNSFPDDYYPVEAQKTLRLSSKNHVLLQLTVKDTAFSVFISHPTPPVFDGPEDRNGKRNFDEISAIALVCNRSVDQFHRPIVVMGDLNADPNDGESIPGAIDQLLDNRRFTDPQPRSRGGVEKALADGGINAEHQTDPALDTADWGDQPPRGSGNLRVDYVLPTHDWTVVDAGVFWPAPDETGHGWIDASDHRLVWVDLKYEVQPGESAPK
ncbi:endonuclease/exonuclease/phosphatase family protein [Algisphaera agarilytica]|uniref:Endonuclease/exonuclease/phosphatase family metal-dependent hydrolase n=1 Tax=Algisphaera agarilytica TaxID=1385975 RepID=A0A7X0H6Q3_9BACT|nr:endonuclease/exonuclease/phosphatase family protein [Algisphaera agarilytica]MBB6430072.1 endonuclease/exonuclease/phosphatase family metal-dependent hydrolase [Algisphaera agarilytica]